ncbi:pyruvate kinase [Planctomycetales bacterium]|nr:pyruvate kinase [Planctomycetales bacterium]
MAQQVNFPKIRPSGTKIVATVGPASESEEMIAQLIEAGVDVFRLNMAHGGPEDAEVRLDKIRKVSRNLQIPVGVLADLAGPKMRLGEIPNGQYDCRPEQPMYFIAGEKTTEPDTFTTTYDPLIKDLNTGDKIMLADGTVVLEVAEKAADRLVCKVLQGGIVRSRQGVNLPGAALSIKTLQAQDIKNARWAVRVGIDFLGLSFVRSASDIIELRENLTDEARQYTGQSSDIPHIIAKIEKPEAVNNLEEIVDAADGVMVARGDLGVELDIAGIAVVQKKIISLCRRKSKPVIVATQMLESMHHLTIPTRAEASDVANAILDGADACMLSGETAVGEHPLAAVQMMHRIAVETEKFLRTKTPDSTPKIQQDSITHAVCNAAVGVADEINAGMILATSRSGNTALALSNKRSSAMCVAASWNQRTLQRMNLYWGIVPFNGTETNDAVKILENVVSAGKQSGYLKSGDQIVVVHCTTQSGGHQNALYVYIAD